MSLLSSLIALSFGNFSSFWACWTQGFLGGPEEVRQANTICLLFWHLKHNPFSIHHFCSSGVNLRILIALMSMMLGSLVCKEGEKDWKV